MKLPSLNDISPTNCSDLDERSAVEHFLGKTHQDAYSMIQHGFTRYSKDFAYMGPSAFCWYVPVIQQYVSLMINQHEVSEEVIDNILFIVEVRDMFDSKENKEKYNKTIVEVLNTCYSKMLQHMNSLEYALETTREQRRARSRLKRTIILIEKYS